jgi:hypothetical protein
MSHESLFKPVWLMIIAPSVDTTMIKPESHQWHTGRISKENITIQVAGSLLMPNSQFSNLLGINSREIDGRILEVELYAISIEHQ